MTENCRLILDFISCDYELIPNSSGSDILNDRYNTLSEQGDSDGYIPLIIVPSETLAEYLSYFMKSNALESNPERIAERRQTIIDAANSIDGKSLLQSRIDGFFEEYGIDESEILGDFEQIAPNSAISLHMLAYESSEEVIIAKIPVAKPWELAAWIPMGGFNDCPMPSEQVAVFRYWHEKYGAVPAFVSYDIWQLVVANPPLADNEAEALAKEHFAFCFDTVEQGSETIRRLASSLMNSSAWFFWWD